MLDAREFVLFVNILWSPRLKMASSWHDSLLSNTTTCAYVALSPDGKRMALVLEGSSFDVWVYDLERGTFTRASFGGDDYRPAFSPDGRLLAYDSSKSGAQQVFLKHGIAQGEDTALTEGPEDKALQGLTADAREVIFARHNKDTGWDLYAAAVVGDHKPRPLVVAPFNQTQAAVSPDGKWLAYVSDESGQPEVFVQGMKDPGMRAQISSEGGSAPRWSRSSNELLFLSKNRVMSVKVGTGSGLAPGKPVALFEDKKEWSGYDIAPDGPLVVTREADSNGSGSQINVVTGWFERLKQQQRK